MKQLQKLAEKARQLQQEVSVNPKKARREAIELYNQATKDGYLDVACIALKCILSSFILNRVISKRTRKWIHITKQLLPSIRPQETTDFHILLIKYYSISNSKESAEYHLQEALRIFEEQGYVPPELYLNAAHLHWEYETLEEGWKFLCKAERLLSDTTSEEIRGQPKHINQLIMTYSLTAMYFMTVGNYLEGEQYARAGIALASENIRLKAQLLLQLCNILLETNRIEECWSCVNEASHIYHHTKISVIGVDVEMAKSLLYMQEHRYKEALHHIDQACIIAKRTKEYLLRVRPYILKAEILVNLEDIQQAQSIIEELNAYIIISEKHIPHRFYVIASKIYELQGNIELSAHYKELFMKAVLKISLAKLQHKFHVIRKRELGVFEHDELVAKHSSQTQQHVPTPQPKQFPPSAPNTFRQFDVLTSNEYLNAIRSTLVDLFHNADTLNYKTIKAKIKSVQQLIETNYNEQDMLFAVEREIQHVHKDFIEKLSFRYSSLSHTEIRVCLLLRLNLNTHQIAVMMNISPATVFTHRKNIRKKMGITRNESLSILLMQLSGLRVEKD